MGLKEYQICNYCVMDTSDPEITFDLNGRCKHCIKVDKVLNSKPFCLNSIDKTNELNNLVNQIKKSGKGKKYDCIIGVSGGVDSTYVAYLTKKLGLRPLAVHLDNGWDSELAVSNIEKFLKKLDIDLYTYVIDWEEFKDLQLSFLKASTPDSEIPSDHAIVSILYKLAKKYKLKYIIGGNNVQTESIMTNAWSQGYFDWKYIKNIQKKFGTKRLITFPHINFVNFVDLKVLKTIKWTNILDYVDYNKKEIKNFIMNELGWKDYGGKHYESIYTRFFQGYILPKKFGFDKRRAHLSSLIVAGQISRKDALEELKNDPYPSKELLKEDYDYVVSKLGLTKEEFENIMNLPVKKFSDYPSYEKSWYYKSGKRGYKFIKGKL